MSKQPPFSPPLPTRQLLIDFKGGVRRHWNGDDAFSTAYLNAMSMALPILETFLVQTVKESLPELDNSASSQALRHSCSGFTAQESVHRHIHHQYNQALADLGYSNQIERWIKRDLARREKIARQSSKPHLHLLAIAAAHEHLTAVLARQTLALVDTPDDWLKDADEPMRTLWRWHASEEIEHRSVSFDLYAALGGNHKWRRVWFNRVWRLIMLQLIIQTYLHLWRDSALRKWSTWRSGFHFLFSEHGLIRFNWKSTWAYVKEDFHPESDDSQTLASNWFSKNQVKWRAVNTATPKTAGL